MTPTYHPFWDNMLYAEVAHRAKVVGATYVNWHSVFDPEIPSGSPGGGTPAEMPPTLDVFPPFQVMFLSEGFKAEVSAFGNTNPPGRAATLQRSSWRGTTIIGIPEGTNAIQSHASLSPPSTRGTYRVTHTLVDLVSELSTTVSVSVEYKSTDQCVYAVSDEGIAYVTFDTGESWKAYDIRVEKNMPGLKLRSVASDTFNRLTAWFGDSDGRVWKTEAGLDSVTDYLVQLTGSVESLAIDPYTTAVLLAGCDDGKLYRINAHSFNHQNILPDELIDIGAPITAVCISPVNSNRVAVGGYNKLYISNDYGNTWQQVFGFDGDIKDAQFSKQNPDILMIATSFNCFKVNMKNGYIEANTDTYGQYHPAISTFSSGSDDIILSRINGSDDDWLYIAAPIGSVEPFRPSGATYPDNIQVEKTYDDRIWYSGGSYLFRSYQIQESYLMGTYAVLYASGTINDLDQGPVIGSNEFNAGFELPIIP